MSGFSHSNISTSSYPSNGERLASYVDRMNVYLAQLEEWSAPHITWWTHRSQGACWICDALLQARIMCDIMKDICSEMKKYKFVAEHPKGSTNPEYFTFKMKGRV